MKKLIIALAATTVLAVPAYAAPGNSDEATGAATAEVVAPLTITHDTDAVLSFGTFTAGGAGGTVVVTRGGAGSATGEVNLLAGSVESSDSFSVEGDADRRFSITTTDSTVDFGTFSMDFVTDARANHDLDATGNASFTVGGTLTVGADQEPGVYEGDYTVTVAYN